MADWSQYNVKDEIVHFAPVKQIRDYQKEAIDKVIAGFQAHDRGKLIMPCGTGKTFTSLKLSEKFIENNQRPTQILYLVPSIALVSQTIFEWTKNYSNNEEIDMYAICSDETATRDSQKLNKEKETVQEQLSYIPISATTDPQQIIDRLKLNKTNILFSTYHSIKVIKDIQDALDFEFDLIICDEAHRTVGFDQDEVKEFRRVHNNDFIRSKKRLYMTATPKQYRDLENVKKQADQKFSGGSYRVFSMNDETIYGPIFYEMTFSDAITKNLLTDYKLVVLQYRRSQYAKEIEGSEWKLTNGARILGSLAALSKYTEDDNDKTFESDPKPMQRAIAFFNKIEYAEEAEKSYKDLYKKYVQNNVSGSLLLEPEVQTISSKNNTREKNAKIQWLKESVDEGFCRILTNPKSLTEGVDIPNLDAIIFMQKKNSQVDIIQAVGRIMRKSEGKKFGYIVIPVDVEDDLSKNEEFKTIYHVIQALRSHDERINEKIAQAQLANKTPSFICIMKDPKFNLKDQAWASKKAEDIGDTSFEDNSVQTNNIWENPDALNLEMNAILFKKLGNRIYWDSWSEKIAQITKDIATIIKAKLESNNSALKQDFKLFKEGLKNLINPNFDDDEECYSILAQHVATLPVLKSLFNAKEDFLSKNAFISLLNKMVDKLGSLNKEVKGLTKFYESIERSINEIKDDDFARQDLIKKIYDDFFKHAVPKEAEKYGVVYTPIEVIDFMINSVSYLLKTKLNMELKDKRVKILEPFAGTGTFVSRILTQLKQEGASPAEIENKYTSDIIFHEILLTAYYTSLVNIEYTYYRLNNEYKSFENSLWIDTFYLAERWYTKNTINLYGDFESISEKAKEVNEADISVIIGNPPYRGNQKSANNNNANTEYENINQRIKQEYLSRMKDKVNVVSVYNPYVKAIRFASDRIHEKGIIAFILDGGFIDNVAFAGFRSSLLKEFNSVYVYDLLGNVRNHSDRHKQGENIFGSGSQSKIAILFCVKDGTNQFENCVNYHQIGSNLKTAEKLSTLKNEISIRNITWEKIQPDLNHDWINKRNESFNKCLPIGNKKTNEFSIFQNNYSRGIVTGFDAWSYNFSKDDLEQNINKLVKFYNEERIRYHTTCNKAKVSVKDFVNKDKLKIQWNDVLFKKCEKNIEISSDNLNIVPVLYRPFVKKYTPYNDYLIREVSKWKNLISQSRDIKTFKNKFLLCSGKGHTNPCYFSSNVLLNLDILPKSQCFPFYWFEDNKIKNNESQNQLFDDETSTKIEAINSDAVNKFQKVYNDNNITSNDIFNYIYGVLSCPTYVTKYKNDLMKSLPAIPFLDNFWKYSKIGEELMDLHINYETQEPYKNVTITKTQEDYTIRRIKFGNKDKSVIIYNDYIKIEKIPLEAYEYKVNGKAPLEWVVSEYKHEVNKETKIINNPNNFDEIKKGKYIYDLILSLITVSLKTRDLINSLPEYKELDVEQ